MTPILRISALAAMLLLGSCAAQSQGEAIENTDAEITTTGDTSTTSVANVPFTAPNEEPLVLAFGSADCAQIESSDDHHSLGEALPPEALDEFESVMEFVAATNAVGESAREKFERVSAAVDGDAPLISEPVSKEAEEAEEAALTARHLAAFLDPDLPEAAARLALEIEASCGSSDVSDGFFKMAELATFMQVIPSDEYCWALAPFSAATHSELKAAAPAEHQTWIDQLGTARESGDDLAELGTILLYGQAHCT